MAWVTPSNVATGDVLTASTWNQDVVENTSVLYASQKRLAIQTSTSNVASGATVGANEVFSDLTFTAAGSVTYVVEVYIPYIETGLNSGAYIEVHLTNGSSTSLGMIGFVGKGNGSVSAIGCVYAKYGYTPSAGSVTLNVSGKTVVAAGNLGAIGGVTVPAFIAVYGPDLT